MVFHSLPMLADREEEREEKDRECETHDEDKNNHRGLR